MLANMAVVPKGPVNRVSDDEMELRLCECMSHVSKFNVMHARLRDARLVYHALSCGGYDGKCKLVQF